MADLLVTGVLSPDAAGVYAEAGVHNARPYWRRGSDDWYIWSIFDSTWETWLSTALGSTGGEGWWIQADSPVGTLVPYATWTGNAEVQYLGSIMAAVGPRVAVVGRRRAAARPVASSPVALLPPLLAPRAIEGRTDRLIVPMATAAWLRPELGDPGLYAAAAAVLGPRPPARPRRRRVARACSLALRPPGPPLARGARLHHRRLARPKPVSASIASLRCLAGRVPRPAISATQRRRLAVPANRLRIRHWAEARGKYRIFNEPQYRFYRSGSGPPAETDTPFATSSTLPATPADTYADGTWYLSCSWFNGCIDSGFFPIGPNGETYLWLEISGGAGVGDPPNGPADWRLEQTTGGIVRIHALYHQDAGDRATEWAIGYTTDGSDPPADTPDLTQDLATAAGLDVLQYDLPAVAHGLEVRVRLQLRRNDGTDEEPSWVYSADSEVQSLTISTTGPGAPLGGDGWPGQIHEQSS